MIYLQLFWAYLKIGFLGFGGGYAMLSLIQYEVISNNQWLTESQFADIVAISQITPGPIAINSATYVGYEIGGIFGSMVATFAVCLPALTLMLLLTKFVLKVKDNRYGVSIIAFLKPVVVGMILSAALILIINRNGESENFIDLWSWAFFLGSLALSYKKVNPILIIVLSALAGTLVYAIF